MNEFEDSRKQSGDATKQALPPVVAFLVTMGFVWLIFDNLALGLIFGLMAAAASGGAQKMASKNSD